MNPSAQDHLSRAAVFAAVAREGSFSAAARALGVARSTVSEHVASLESALGARLLERTTRTVRLTEEGELVFHRIDSALKAWDEAFTALEERGGEPIGMLRVTTAGGLARALVGPACGALVAAHPRVNVELIVDDQVRDLVADRIDVAVRMAPLQDSSLACRKLGSTGTVLVGAPSLAGEDALDRGLEGITDLGWVSHGAVPAPTVNVHDEAGALHVIRPTYRGEGSNGEAQMSLVASGCGIALMPELLVRDEIAAGRLRHIFPEWHGRQIPIYAVYSRSSFTQPRVSRFLELVIDRLGEGALD